ncbi:MAG TPA: hypothetical protein VD699_03835 [Nitrosopumilaceae archaeon]|nr:hypothetical protein [Nitrosopumilaceae archaeon]
MASLSNLVKSYKNKKMEATKSRRQSENRLQSTLSLKRKSSSGLSSLEKKKDVALRKKEEFSQLLNQYTAQKESVQRLKTAAEGRLKLNEEEKERIAQEMEFSSSPEDKARITEKMKSIDQKIAELHSEIKQRRAAEERLEKQIGDVTKSKSKIDLQIRVQAQTKPLLLEQFKSSSRAEEILRSQVKSKMKQEEQAKHNLIKITERLAILQAKKRKAKRKAKKKIRRKSKTKRKIRKVKKSKTTKRSKTRTRKAKKRKPKVKHKAKTRKAKRKVKSKPRR